MDQKPSDFFLSVIDIFGILIPGGVLAYLHGDFILKPFKLSLATIDSTAEWILAFFASFVLGHFLLGFSGWLDRVAQRWPSKETIAYEKAVKKRLRLPAGVLATRANVFLSAFSFIRINSSEAMVELERQAAEYKLFRNLTLVFLIDIPLSALSGQRSLARLMISLLIVGLAFYRFQWLFDWTYQLAFDFYLQLQKQLIKNEQPSLREQIGEPREEQPR